MKIILSAFGGKLMSKPMEVPENTTPRWDMVLTQPLTVFSGSSGQELSTNPPFDTRCTFEWTGKYLDGARYYQLTDITKY